MGRDLLYKPPVPLVLPEEGEDGKKPGPPPAAGTDLAGFKRRPRELGATAEPQAPAAGARRGEGRPGVAATALAAAVAAAQAAEPEARDPAFKAAYFNRDVVATAEANMRASPMRALRGAAGATDLRRIVLPPAALETPSPAALRAAGQLMGVADARPPGLEQLLARHAQWLRGQAVTAEIIAARMAQLQAMISARIAALGRMARRQSYGADPTVAQALAAQGGALDGEPDIGAAGERLVGGATARADGLHARLAKALGSRRGPT